MLSCPLSHERSYLYILVDVERRVMGCILLTSQQESGTWSYLGMWTRHHKKQQAKSWKWEGMLCQKLGFSFTLLNIISVIGSSSIIDLTKGNRNINRNISTQATIFWLLPDFGQIFWAEKKIQFFLKTTTLGCPSKLIFKTKIDMVQKKL